jgi:hypothetical protein
MGTQQVNGAGKTMQDFLYAPDVNNIDGQGKLAYTLANKRCKNFKTCGANGDATTGEAKVNIDLSVAFRRGQEEILVGNCAGVVPYKNDIVKLMTVPLIQGSLRYAYKCDKSATCSQDAVGELAIFVAAVIPQVHDCNPTAANTIATSALPSAHTCTSTSSCTSSVTDFAAVKAAFESCYSAMGVTCSQVGGLWDGATSQYMSTHGDASPCGDWQASDGKTEEKIPSWGVAVVICLAVLMVMVCLGFLLLIMREKQGKPIFLSMTKAQA